MPRLPYSPFHTPKHSPLTNSHWHKLMSSQSVFLYTALLTHSFTTMLCKLFGTRLLHLTTHYSYSHYPISEIYPHSSLDTHHQYLPLTLCCHHSKHKSCFFPYTVTTRIIQQLTRTILQYACHQQTLLCRNTLLATGRVTITHVLYHLIPSINANSRPGCDTFHMGYIHISN